MKNKIIVISLFILFGFFSTYEKTSRSPSSSSESYEVILIKKQQCQRKERKSCLRQFPYSLLKRKWSEVFEYQFLNRRNIVQAKFYNCQLEGNILCADRFSFYEESKRLNEIREGYELDKQISRSKNNTFWNGMKESVNWNSNKFWFKEIKLSPHDLRDIWTNFYSISKVFSKIIDTVHTSKTKITSQTINALHGVGLSFTPKASIGIGGQINFEAVIHDGKLGFFCAPGIQVETDVGVSASVGHIKTLGCSTNQEYAGKFFTLSAGLSGETLGLPVSIGGSYSIALGLKEILSELAFAKKSGIFTPLKLLSELDEFASLSGDKLLEIFGNQKMASASIIVLKMMAKLAGEDSVENQLELDSKLVEFQKMNNERINYKEYFPIGTMLKKMTRKIKIIVERDGSDLTNTLVFLNALERNLDSCDAISGQIGLSLSLSPISLEASLYQYVEVGEVDLNDLIYLTNMNPRKLASIATKKDDFSKFKTTLKRVLTHLPTYESFGRCATTAKEGFNQEFKDLRTIFSKE